MSTTPRAAHRAAKAALLAARGAYVAALRHVQRHLERPGKDLNAAIARAEALAAKVDRLQAEVDAALRTRIEATKAADRPLDWRIRAHEPDADE